ncbi:hypothetical protein ABZ297_10865 [Nonomuraea sp. NPDC005983]
MIRRAIVVPPIRTAGAGVPPGYGGQIIGWGSLLKAVIVDKVGWRG